MFFILSKVLLVFIFPLPLFILLQTLAALFSRRIQSRHLLALPALLLWIFSTVPVSQSLIRGLEDSYPPVPVEQVKKADYIIVLGGMVQNNTRYPERPELNGAADRLFAAAELWKNDKADTILFSGGSGMVDFPNQKEADSALYFLKQLGVPSDKIILESESKNTYENAVYSHKLIPGDSRVILVTSAFHMMRAIDVFQNAGIQVVDFYPVDYKSVEIKNSFFDYVPDLASLGNSSLAIKEWMGMVAYRFAGYM